MGLVDSTGKFDHNITAVVFKDNKSEDRYIAYGVGYLRDADPADIKEIENTISKKDVNYTVGYRVDEIERVFDFTVTEERRNFDAEDDFVVDRSEQPLNPVESLLGVQLDVMKV